ncbi:hypothetical protein [Thiofilum flexile]|uniref:hypothetical protein n=1 Tax=Thiofilum flexile TaxID=125627 RepID=UPI00036F3A47|nr:hypothetical protein [Thiofilum flexile]
MATIELRGADPVDIQQLSEQLVSELKGLDADVDWQIHYSTEHIESKDITRGIDLVPYIPIAVAAVSAGGALSLFLSQDSILGKIAQIFEKQVENKKAELIIKTEDGSSIEIRANMTGREIENIIREVNRRDRAASTDTTTNTSSSGDNTSSPSEAN